MTIAVLYIITYIIEAIIFYLYISQVFYLRSNNFPKTFSTIMVGYFILYLLSFLDKLNLNAVFFLVMNVILIYILCSAKLNSAFFHSVILTCVMDCSEIFVIHAILHFSHNFYENRSNTIKLVLLIILSKLLYFLITCLLTAFFAKEKEISIKKTRGVALLILIPFTSLFILFCYSFITEYISPSSFLDYLTSISTVLILFMNFFVFWYYHNNLKREAEFAELQVQLQHEKDLTHYHTHLTEQSENHRLLVHDIKKHLFSLKELNNTGQTERITAYLDALIQSSDLKENIRVSDNDFLNAILLRYKQECEQKNISLHLDIRAHSIDFMSDNDLTTLFCNLLENAIEAAYKIPDCYIELTVHRKENNKRIVVITMENSCLINPFSPKTGKLLTKKSNQYFHGIGLKSIERIVKKFNGEMTVYYDEETFSFHTVMFVLVPD